MNKNSIAVVILAAGFSTRMGKHKSLLMFDKKKRFIQQVVEVYKNCGMGKILIVANCNNIEKISSLFPKGDFEDLTIVLNEHPEYERFYSLKQGLKKIEGFKACFIQSCDNPFVNEELIFSIMNEFILGHVVIPSYLNRKGHPILLCRSLIEDVLKIERNDCTLRDVLREYPSKLVLVTDEKILVNINTWEEYGEYFSSIIF